VGCSTSGGKSTESTEHKEPARNTDLIGRGDKALTLLGVQPPVGSKAPDFKLKNTALEPVVLSDYAGKALIISVVPSIDTRVCETQTHRMTEEEKKLPDGVALLTVSRDLPFAQRRFVEENQVKTTMASDYHGGSFGSAWGLEVDENGLLARSVWLIGADGTVRYRELVPDQGSEPDYEALLAALSEL